MHEVAVRGEMEMAGLRTGTSGRFTGDIEGLYEAYREGYPIGSPGEDNYRTGNPDVQHGSIELANGTLAFTVRHVIPIQRERGENPWKDGRDPWKNPPAGAPRLPTEHAPGGPPAAVGQAPGGSPGAVGQAPGGPPGADGPPQIGPMPLKYLRRVQLTVDGDRSTGMWAGATGEMFVEAPKHREYGYVEVDTPKGKLHMTFTEHPEGGKLVADLEVQGAKSTGIYADARGELKFALEIHRGVGLGRGPYWGTLWLAGPADASR